MIKMILNEQNMTTKTIKTMKQATEKLLGVTLTQHQEELIKYGLTAEVKSEHGIAYISKVRK